MEVRVEKEPTGAQEYVIDDMPTALRQALTGAFEQEDEEAIQKAAETQVPLPDAPRARIRNKGSEPVERMGTDTRRRLNRRAFNLESEDDPNHRTGAGLVQVPKLENLDDQEP
jgi:hypothetical protein